MEVPTLQNHPHTHIHLIGGEKGGVGKSMMARVLAQFFIDRQRPFIGFDTDRSHSTFSRFYAEFAAPVVVDRYEALDRIIESAVEQPGRRVLVDLAAQTHAPVVKWMEDSGVLDVADLSGIGVHYWHVMDVGRDSVDLLQRVLDQFGPRVRYVVVLNQLHGSDFSQLEASGLLERARALGARVITLKQLHHGVVQKIDAQNSSFWSALHSGSPAGLGLMERQRLKMWLGHAYGEVERAGA
ncbi:MAG: mobilization protein [Burkholderiales bacterium]